MIVSHFSEYIIPFRGMAEGLHEFHYEIEDSFFKLFETSDITKGSMNLDVVFEKKTNLMSFQFIAKGRVVVMCDLCLDDLDLDLSFDEKLFVKFGPEYDEPDADVIIIPDTQDEINIAQFIFEYIHLNLPFKRVHPKDEDGNPTCNPEMLEELNKHLVEDEGDYTDPDDEI